MNPNLHRLQPYPFEKLGRLFAGITPPVDLHPIRLSIGEPQHATPTFIRQALVDHLDGLSHYPATQGSDDLRHAIGEWIAHRYKIAPPAVLPVNGSREALFAFAQCVADTTQPDGLVLCPNPFYQIYEGAACLAGLTPVFCNQTPHNHFAFDIAKWPDDVLRRVQLVYACSPGNPTGRVLSLQEWNTLFELSDRYGFVIASDECYSEIYFDTPPLGGLEAAHQLNRDHRNLVMFSSLSKRSNVPGLRSGFVAGDPVILEQFRLYRTYHGCAMNPAVQSASAAAWRDEIHVQENRTLYREKFARVLPILAPYLEVDRPDAGFYLWASVSKCATLPDTEFARELYRRYNVTVLPGSFLAREAHGINPGANFIRIALVAPLDECEEAAHRIADFCRNF
ncbi:MAG: succinyldiaminopimelate transaminase [Rhodocyclaceae bacterium]|nr:succinyldiaminopimelate transaminase [Rhodocyclaceae bacterium]